MKRRRIRRTEKEIVGCFLEGREEAEIIIYVPLCTATTFAQPRKWNELIHILEMFLLIIAFLVSPCVVVV